MNRKRGAMTFRMSAAIACLLLAACAREQEEASATLDAAGAEVGASYNKMRDMLGLSSKPKAANLSKARLIQQATIAVLAQANSAPQAVLSLLRGN